MLSRLSVGQLSALACERGYSKRLQPLHVIQQYLPASVTTWFSFKGISHQDLLLHVPFGHLPTANSRPCPGIALRSLSSSSWLACIPGDLHPCLGHVGLWQALSLCFVFPSTHLRSTAVLSNSLKCFSSVPINCVNVRI